MYATQHPALPTLCAIEPPRRVWPNQGRRAPSNPAAPALSLASSNPRPSYQDIWPLLRIA